MRSKMSIDECAEYVCVCWRENRHAADEDPNACTWEGVVKQGSVLRGLFG